MTDKFLSGKRLIYIIAGAVSVILSLVFMAVFSAAVYFFNIDRSFIPFLSTLSVAAGCFCGSYYAAKKLCEKGYLTGLIIGGAAFFIITAVSLLMGKGGFTFNTLFHFVIIILASVIGGITGVNRSDKRII